MIVELLYATYAGEDLEGRGPGWRTFTVHAATHCGSITCPHPITVGPIGTLHLHDDDIARAEQEGRW